MSDRLRSLLEAGVAERAVPGGQLVVRREGRAVFEEAFGRRGPGLDPVRAATRYDLASLTKAVGTSILWAQAWERGCLDPADRLASTFPGADPRVEHKHLLQHRSGLPAHIRFDRRLPVTLAPGARATRAWIQERAARAPLEATPDERSRYTDLGFIALGAAVERLTGREPGLALAALGCPLTDLAAVRRAEDVAPTFQPHRHRVHDDNAWAMGGICGHAGLFGTASHVADWTDRLLAAFHGDRSGPLAPETVRTLWAPRKESIWTWGWDRPTPGGSTGDVWPADAVGHLGYTGTSIWIHPATGLTATLLTNRTVYGENPEQIRRFRRSIMAEVWERGRG